MKSLMKEKKEDLVKRIETLVFEFSPSCCLALIQQCLQYLDEMTAGVDEVMVGPRNVLFGDEINIFINVEYAYFLQYVAIHS